MSGVVHRDEGVGVGRVADHEDLDVVGRAARERRALRGEDRAVGLEQVAALHALRAGPRADQQGDVRAVERLVGIVGLDHAGQQREGAVVELHRHALERAERGRDLQQLQDHGLVGPEQLAAGDAEQEAVTDLAGGTGDSLILRAGSPSRG